MTSRLRIALACVLCGTANTAGAGLGPRQPSAAELLRRIERLNVVGNVLYVGAHPDDENTRLLAQAELAIDYFELHAQEALIQLYGDTVRAYRESFDLNQKGFGVEVEMTSKSLRNGFRYCEIPIGYSYRTVGTSKIRFSDGLKSMIQLFSSSLQE